ncbi:SMI1/KNR4 family protein [Aliikangiella coralliicola]|nr:SMI1/KNR4 family protein [Aliikangiella coralliicola]
MEELKLKLDELKKEDERCNAFGASSHGYELNIPLSETEFKAIEAKYGCIFPDEYREFITTVGNGGAGPFYGVFPIEMEDDNHDMCSWTDGTLVGNLSKPFPYSSNWNLPDSFWENEPDCDNCESDEEEDALWETWEEQLNEKYWAENVMSGAIPICHAGCARRIWMVVSGPMKGTIWSDLRADYAGIELLKDDDGRNLSFKGWYLSWLNKSLKEIRESKN